MEPKSYPGTDSTRVVELDTGVYRIAGDVVWTEFEIDDLPPRVMAEMTARFVARLVKRTIKKAREEGKEVEYLGIQARRVEGEYKLEGCVVFARPGDYWKIAGAGADYGMEMIGRVSWAMAP